VKAVHVRREVFGDGSAPPRLRVMFASDLHLGLPWTRGVAAEIIDVADAAAPDVVLLGGDLVDNPRGLDAMEECVSALRRGRVVGAIAGNHDVAAGVDDVRRRALRAGARWLADEPLLVETRGGPVRFCGGALGPAPCDVTSVACLHDPADAASAASSGCVLAFAGHLHGGQCVFFERRDRLYPGAWFNRWTGLRFQVGAMRLFVSRGLGDTLPLRFNCPREVIVCDLKPS
jgi:predicted MPP superfamily phosphohydrolase